MKFHLIHNSGSPSDDQVKIAPKLFESACAEQSIDFVLHDVQNMDLFELPVLGSNDLLYRSAICKKAIEAQRRMISPDCTTFHKDWKSAFNVRGASYFLHKANGLPAIPSFSGIPSTEKDIKQCVEELGHFPLIIKVTGGSLGVGVIRVDSIQSMRSVLDYLESLNVNVLIRKYIDHDYYVRAIVVGNKLVASHAAFTIGEEFRTNAGDDTFQKREARVLPADQQAMIVKSVNMLGFETGGVDLLFDKDDNLFIAEVNFPNNFTVTQRVTGVDIASEMVAHLARKAQSLTEVVIAPEMVV
jgi:glutathione synthase/RimK-type ligase-like ATP-grasp enzyme